MAKTKGCSFCPPPRILTRGRILVLAIAFLFGIGSAQADILELKVDQPGSHNWSSSGDFNKLASCTEGIRVVHCLATDLNKSLTLRTPAENNNVSIHSIYLGYTYDTSTNTYTIVGEEAQSKLALKNQGANTITVSNLYLGNGLVAAYGADKPTLAGKIYVEGTRSEIFSQDATIFYLNSSIYKNSPDACLNLLSYYKSGTLGEIWIRNSANVNCPLNLKQGKIVFAGDNTFGSNFALTLQDGTSIIMSANYAGVEDTTITVNGSVRYVHNGGTVANKVNFSNFLIPEGSTLNAKNNYGDGAIGSMTFAGDLQGSGALVVDTVGSTNTNSFTLGHSENSFTGTVDVQTGKLQFTVLGFDNVTYTGTNALINAESVTLASGATIDVGATTQTFNNLSGAGTVTISEGGALTLNYTSETIFSGNISSTEEVIKTGNGTLKINEGANINCPLNVNQGQLYVNGTNLSGSNFSLTLQDGTSIVLSGNNIGKADTAITVKGTVSYSNASGTGANKVNYSDVLISEGATLNTQNNNGVGAKGSMVFAGNLQGSGTLAVDTVGTTNTNSLTLGHSENSFTGTVDVQTGKLQFTVLGFDNVIYTGTNALINAKSVTLASGATIDVGTTTQTFNNFSGAGTVTISEGGALTLNNTDLTTFSGSISGSGKGNLIKTGAGTLLINAAQGAVDVESLVVSSGRLDMKSYFIGALEVEGGATFSPGNSIGTLNQTGNFTLDNSATLLMEIGGTDAEQNDQLIVSGSISLAEGSIIELVLANDNTLNPGDTFTAVLSGSNSGSDGFANDLLSHIRSYYFTDLDYVDIGNGTYAITGYLDPNAVPEPATWALMALGVAGLMYWRKRK